MTEFLKKTPLHDWHAGHGGRMVDFAGWSMPVQYSSIVEEHRATREAVGLFDISHMGRLRFEGRDAARFLDLLVTRRVDSLKQGQIRYGLVTNEQGGILDDVLVYQLEDLCGPPYLMMVVNASNREKIVSWIEAHLDASLDVRFSDLTHDWAMIAVQGPRALELLKPHVETDLAAMKYYTGTMARIGQTTGVVSRTGYTGEDGAELIVPNAAVNLLWEKLLAEGEPLGIKPCGLAARDTLRLEAGMPLYGHEMSEAITPIEAGLAFAVNLKDRTFIGSEAIRAAAERRDELPRRIGLEMEGRRVPRERCEVFAGDQRVGEVTSGTFSPTLDRPIAMAYVAPAHAAEGTELQIDIRGKRLPARVVPLPFYKRS